jgi:fumarylpyruvate hydrolase
MTQTFAFAPPPIPSVPVEGSGARFPVRRILCVGRNYAAHVREMGGDAGRETPLFFTKPADAVVPEGGNVPYPSATSDLHHEVELVIAIDGEGRDLSPDAAAGVIFGWAVGVDLTRRDLQAAAKKAGAPWDAAKAFDASAPIAPIVRVVDVGSPTGRISLAVNGETRQDADLADMIWKPTEIVAQASKLWRLAPGDLIFTGTPEGVGPLNRGDAVACKITGLPELDFVMV